MPTLSRGLRMNSVDMSRPFRAGSCPPSVSNRAATTLRIAGRGPRNFQPSLVAMGKVAGQTVTPLPRRPQSSAADWRRPALFFFDSGAHGTERTLNQGERKRGSIWQGCFRWPTYKEADILIGAGDAILVIWSGERPLIDWPSVEFALVDLEAGDTVEEVVLPAPFGPMMPDDLPAGWQG